MASALHSRIVRYRAKFPRTVKMRDQSAGRRLHRVMWLVPVVNQTRFVNNKLTSHSNVEGPESS